MPDISMDARDEVQILRLTWRTPTKLSPKLLKTVLRIIILAAQECYNRAENNRGCNLTVLKAENQELSAGRTALL